MNKLQLAYAAGVVDSDGCITIKRRKVWNERLRKSVDRYSYAATVFVRQVENNAVSLLQELFGGSIRIHPPSVAGGRPLFQWEVSNRIGVACAKNLLPYLRIKKRQAEILVEFDALMRNHEARRHPYWFRWIDGEPTYDTREAAAVKGVSVSSVYQMISNDTIPVRHEGRRVLIPKRFWDAYETGRRGRTILPPEYLRCCEELCGQIRSLNGPTRGIPVASR